MGWIYFACLHKECKYRLARSHLHPAHSPGRPELRGDVVVDDAALPEVGGRVKVKPGGAPTAAKADVDAEEKSRKRTDASKVSKAVLRNDNEKDV